jgi:hypothetical protein
MFAPPMAGTNSTAPDAPRPHAAIAASFVALPAAAKVGALAFELVSRQAEGRLLFSGKEYVERKASEHGVVRADAATSAGNVLTILERGAENDAERTLLAVATVHGLSSALEGADDEGARTALIARFVRHVDYLELGTPISIWSVLPETLAPRFRPALHAELAQRIVDDGSGERGRAPAARARNAGRLSALARWADTEPSARKALDDVIHTRSLDAPTLALASALLPEGGTRPSTAAATELKGLLERPRSSGIVRGLMLITGLALGGWLLRGLLALIGARREVDLRIATTGIELEERTRAFGRVLRQTHSAFTFAGLRSVVREVRYPRLHLYAGAIALAAGVLVGGTWIFDGVRGGDFRLAATGAALVLGGAVLDLLLDVVVPARRGRVVVEVAAERGRRIRVGDLPLEAADAFVGALRQRMR